MAQLKLTPEQAEQVAAKKARHQKASIDPEWLFVAEFGSFYGWDGVIAILNNQIEIDTADLLLIGAKKVRARNIVDKAIANHVAYSSARSKNPKDAFFKGMKHFTNEAKL